MAAARILVRRLESVVEPRVVEPVMSKLDAVNVPEKVPEAAFTPPVIFAPPCTVVLPRVVEPRVEEPFVLKLVAETVPAEVMVALPLTERVPETERLVEVEFVRVALVTDSEVPERPGAERVPVTARLVAVALVSVALVAKRSVK